MIRRRIILITLMCILIGVLALMPTGFERQDGNETRARALVISSDNTGLVQHGIIRTGVQKLELKVLSGPFRDRKVTSGNQLIGKMEFDKIFEAGDTALVVIGRDGENILYVNVIDHYRIHIELLLFMIFAIFLILFAGWTGVKAFLSFVFSILAIWKILIPLFLRGHDPVMVSLAVVTLLSGVIIFLVGGTGKKGVVAFTGALSGVMLTALLSVTISRMMNIHGAVKPFAETLLYTGFPGLNLSGIFMAGVFLASSGAVMDIAMDISASMHEVFIRHPEISGRELYLSGAAVGKSVIGTMTTTLLLAYTGSYTALLMVLAAQGVPVWNILNLSYVSAEILHTLVGSFGLVAVAPLTALSGSFIYRSRAHT